MPYTSPGEPTHSARHPAPVARPDAARPSWEPTHRVLAAMLDRAQLDTIVTGLKVGVLDLSTPGSPPVAAAGHRLRLGRLARRRPATRSTTPWAGTPGCSAACSRRASRRRGHDFGAAGIARDVHVVGDRLAAIVGGRVHVRRRIPTLGPIQRDSGGIVHVVDLASGADSPLERPRPLPPAGARRPTGDRVVAEGYPLIIVDVQRADSPDTTVARDGDLYLFAAP